MKKLFTVAIATTILTGCAKNTPKPKPVKTETKVKTFKDMSLLEKANDISKRAKEKYSTMKDENKKNYFVEPTEEIKKKFENISKNAPEELDAYKKETHIRLDKLNEELKNGV